MSIELSRLIRPETVCLNLKSTDKDGVIGELVEILAVTGELTDAAEVLAAVLERERKMSTGMQHGIAIPHAKTNAVRDIVAAVGVHRRGVEFQSLDGRPTHIFIITVSPLSRSGPHVQFLAEVSRILAGPGTRDALLRARSADEAAALFSPGG